jgi:hypothetical protein
MVFFCNPVDNRNRQPSTHIRLSDLDRRILVESLMLLPDCGACRTLSPGGSTSGILMSRNHTLMDVTLTGRNRTLVDVTLTILSVAETFPLEAVG